MTVTPPIPMPTPAQPALGSGCPPAAAAGTRTGEPGSAFAALVAQVLLAQQAPTSAPPTPEQQCPGLPIPEPPIPGMPTDADPPLVGDAGTSTDNAADAGQPDVGTTPPGPTHDAVAALLAVPATLRVPVTQPEQTSVIDPDAGPDTATLSSRPVGAWGAPPADGALSLGQASASSAPSVAARPGTEGAESAPTPAPATTGTTLPAGPTPGAPQTTVAAAVPLPPTSPSAAVPVPTVSHQVIPEVSRLVSAGNGTHRLTMTLQPEALGEVRVVVTVRAGEVHVRLAGGEDAQRALLEGAPELRRVLELTGATDTRIVVRDLAPTTAPATTPSGSTDPGLAGTARDRSGDGDDGGAQTPDQHAGTRAGSTAKDGTGDGANPPRLDPVTSTRPAGVDVTM